jgi:hypothetical protein
MRKSNDVLKVVVPEIFREIRGLRALVNSVLNGAVTTGASAMVTFAQNAVLKFLDQSYLVFNDGAADQIRIGRQLDSSIGILVGSQIQFRSSGSAILGGGVGITSTGAFSPSSFGSAQTGAIWMGTGVPSNADGTDGDFFFRSDGTVAAHTVLYHKQAGVWVATGA